MEPKFINNNEEVKSLKMKKTTKKLIEQKYKKQYKKKLKRRYLIRIFIIIVLIIIIIFFPISPKTIKKVINYLIQSKNEKEVEINEFIKDFEFFNEKKNEEYIKEQNDFCINMAQYNKEIYETKIINFTANFSNILFNMYIYKSSDYISNAIKHDKNWENKETENILEALNYYSKIKNIRKEDIYTIDIGANIGWYSIVLGKFGYNVLSFEPSDINCYILKKNYCLNKDIKMTLINKGLFNEDQICDYYMSILNVGDGWVICDKNVILPNDLVKKGNITLTKLSNYIPFLITKNLAFIKIDVEGSEGKAFEGGIELITKYHVPFIFMEFTPKSLLKHGTNPKDFLLLFDNNGYKFSLKNFFDKNYLTVSVIMKANYGLVNLYIIHSKTFENENFKY